VLVPRSSYNGVNNYKKRRKIDNQIQVGHNVEIGEHRNCRSNWRCRFDDKKNGMIGGQVGIADIYYWDNVRIQHNPV
jgi:UDP-3-O-[3-hydroxymyristoyl] glucosamine N-acyltransferase